MTTDPEPQDLTPEYAALRNTYRAMTARVQVASTLHCSMQSDLKLIESGQLIKDETQSLLILGTALEMIGGHE